MSGEISRLRAHEDLPDLPQIIRDLREAIGWAATLTLVEAHGGCPVCVPSEFHPSHALVRLIGPRATVALIERFRGERIDLPKLAAPIRALRDRDIARKYHEQGYTSRRLATENNLTARQIWNILRAQGVIEDRQHSLFDAG